MEWVKPFFDRAAVWWGPPRLRQSDEDRAGAVERICGIGTKTILELGAGGGTTTVAMASRGHHVTAIELSATRMAHARELLRVRPSIDVTLIHGDFYTAQVGPRSTASRTGTASVSVPTPISECSFGVSPLNGWRHRER